VVADAAHINGDALGFFTENYAFDRGDHSLVLLFIIYNTRTMIQYPRYMILNLPAACLPVGRAGRFRIQAKIFISIHVSCIVQPEFI
jgi:hypothetical protein